MQDLEFISPEQLSERELMDALENTEVAPGPHQLSILLYLLERQDELYEAALG